MQLNSQTIAVFLLMAALLGMLSRRLRMPYGIGLVIAAIALALIPFGSNLEISRELLFTVFLPPLVFTAAFQLRWRELGKDLPVVLSVATVGGSLSAAATTFGMHYLAHFNWASAALFGGLIAASDQLCVIEGFKRANGRLVTPLPFLSFQRFRPY